MLSTTCTSTSTDEIAEDRYLARLTRKLWSRLADGKVGAPELVAGIAEAARGGHFKMYSRSGSDQDALAELEAAGTSAHTAPKCSWFSTTMQRVTNSDYLLERRIKSRVEPDPECDATITTTVALDNTALPGPPFYLLGPAFGGMRRA